MIDPKLITALYDIVDNRTIAEKVRAPAMEALIRLLEKVGTEEDKPKTQCRCIKGNFNSHFRGNVRDAVE